MAGTDKQREEAITCIVMATIMSYEEGSLQKT
jgi:hypothetical protein